MVTVTRVEENSLAAKAGVAEGDILISINGNEIADVLDYRFYLAERKVELLLHRGPNLVTVTIRKGTYDDIGLDFETPLMDRKQSCKNKCIFCFIDQLPKGLRPSLYFKDDDSRLSFLHGNYITLTNLYDKDIDRIIKMRFSPINISVHTTNPDLRVEMMKNPRAGEVLSYIGRLAEAGITIHTQIVLCKGYNDGEELTRTMQDLSRYAERVESVSVVPAGLTRFRESLTKLTPFTQDEARAVIAQVNAFGDKMKKTYGNRIFACADELYITADLPLPDADYYEGYPQIENGVGMITSMRDELRDALSDGISVSIAPRHVSVATGDAAYPTMCAFAHAIESAFPQVKIDVYRIENRFFGESVTVAGLLTGEDYLEQLKDKPIGDVLFISKNSARNDEGLFLCGMTVQELSDRLSTPIVPLDADGYSFLDAVLGLTGESR